MSTIIDDKEIKEQLQSSEKNNDNKKNTNEAVILRVEKNISVHEMPRKFRSNSFNYSNSKKIVNDQSKATKSYSKDATKKIGMIIMVFGVLVIIALIYLAFSFFLKSPAPAQVITPVVVVEEEESEEEKEVVEDVESESDSEPEAEEEPEEEIVEEEPEEEIVEEEPEVILINDLDNDGLSDVEEALLGSNLNNADSDGDGYDDISELSNLYNPAGDGRLIDNPNFAEYRNGSFGYSVIHPKNWTIISAGGAYSIMFQVGEQSFVQIIAQENVKKEGIRDWYRIQFPLVKNVEMIEGNNWEGIKKEDGLVIYMTDLDTENIYVLSYTSINEGDTKYINIFNAMIDSFIID